MFEAIIGHDRVKRQLKRDVSMRRFHHAYLFSGPDHIGKMALVRELMSQVRNAEAFQSDSPFGRRVLAGQGAGLMSFLDDGETLKVAEIRKIQEFVSLRTADNQFSFCVIEGVERMTHSAANAFLKILEEPSARFIYLMTTSEERKLLATILSRVQFFRCTAPSAKAVEKSLYTRVKNEMKVQELMKLSVGRIALAISMLEDDELLSRMRTLYDYAMILFEDDLVNRFTLADHLSKKDFSSDDLSQFLVYLALKLKHEGAERHLKALDHIQKLNRLFEDTQVNKRMYLEGLFLQIS